MNKKIERLKLGFSTPFKNEMLLERLEEEKPEKRLVFHMRKTQNKRKMTPSKIEEIEKK